MAEDDVVEALAVPDLVERPPEPPRAAIRMEGHAEFVQKEATRLRRLDARLPEIGFLDPRRRIALDAIEQPGGPGGDLSARLERLAALARPVSGEERLLRRGEELDVLGKRFPRGAYGAAEDTGRSDPDV